MKIKKNILKKIIQEEIENLNQPPGRASPEDTPDNAFPGEGFHKDEVPIASVVYLLVGKALDSIHDYRGTMPEHEEVSEDFEFLHETLAKFWRMVDNHEDLAGGETPKELLRPLQEGKNVSKSAEDKKT